jgi:hypothetical protein
MHDVYASSPSLIIGTKWKHQYPKNYYMQTTRTGDHSILLLHNWDRVPHVTMLLGSDP